MKLLENNVLGGNKLNCFKATQVLGGLTQILIWGSEDCLNIFKLDNKLFLLFKV